MKLPDVNVLVNLHNPDSGQHLAALRWLKANPRFATCPLTELGLIRVLMQRGLPSGEAAEVLAHIAGTHRAKLVPADLGGEAAEGVTGHRQTTDFYLARLAAAHRLTLATFDQALAARFPVHCELLAA